MFLLVKTLATVRSHTKSVLQQKLGNVGSVGMGQAMKLKWITLDKSSGQPVVKRKVLVSGVTCLLMMMYMYSTMHIISCV